MNAHFRNTFVFLDEKGGRWRSFRRIVTIGAIMLLVGAIVFFGALLVRPRLDRSRFEPNRFIALPPALSNIPEVSTALSPSARRSPRLEDSALPYQTKNHSSRAPFSIRLALVDDSDPRSITSLRENRREVTHVSPEWFTLTGMPPRLTTRSNPELIEIAARQSLTIIPRLTNVSGDASNPEAVEFYLHGGRRKQALFAAQLARKLVALGVGGIAIHWSNLDPSYQRELTQFLTIIREELARVRLSLWLSVPAGNDSAIIDLDALAPTVDFFVALLSAGGEGDMAGPIAPQSWFREWLNKLAAHGSLRQWIAALGVYGSAWSSNNNRGETLSFYEVMASAGHARGVSFGGSPGLRITFSYQDGDSRRSIWFQDAMIFRNQLRDVSNSGWSGIALDSLGLEDPAVWQVLSCFPTCQPEAFSVISPPQQVAGIGDGDFITITKNQRPGIRSILISDDDQWWSSYRQYPEQAVVFHQGGRFPGNVAITFDDGPDPVFTPRILAILKQRKVRAAFFVTGANAAAHPNIVRLIVEDGHEIGNHTYSHLDVSQASLLRLQVELNSTQRLIEQITGHSTIFFRPPYDVDRTPQSPQEVDAILYAQQLGYLTVMSGIDPTDWDGASARDIVTRVMERRNEGNIILLHDGGGDREATVKALPRILDYLKERGDRIVPLAAQLGVARSVVMPTARVEDGASSRVVAGSGLLILHELWLGAWWILLIASLLLFARTAVLVALAVIHWWRTRHPQATTTTTPLPQPSVSVVIAAYNEERVITRTIRSLLASDYPALTEIIIVDDGSTDATASLVQTITTSDPRVKLLRQPNAGKPAAIASALQEVSNEIVITVDADTLCSPTMISLLAARFHDPRVGAASASIDVIDSTSLLGMIQSLEYAAGFNLDRRAMALIHGITVVPGAAGAIRLSAVAAVGGISPDTLAEDTDLTLAMQQARYLIEHEPRAVAWTEAPSTVRLLVRQRRRWAFGTLQCLWKHRGMLFNREYGALAWFVLPGIWVCHILMTALIPLVDGMMILSACTGVDLNLWLYCLLFGFLDVLVAATACALDGRPLWNVLIAIPMRFLYRPLLAVAVWSAIFRALRGRIVGWGAQHRTGSTGFAPRRRLINNPG